MQNAAVPMETVMFNNQELKTLMINGDPFVAMRPIVEGMGLDWASQTTKFNFDEERWSVVHTTTVGRDGKSRSMLCMPVKKLPMWMATINVGRVREDLQETIRKYQEECFVVLWDYWTKGEAVNPRRKPGRPKKKQTEGEERIVLVDKMITKTKRSLRDLGFYGDELNYRVRRSIYQEIGVDIADHLDLSGEEWADCSLDTPVQDVRYAKGRRIQIEEAERRRGQAAAISAPDGDVYDEDDDFRIEI